MINQQLVDFIKQQLQVGSTKEKISSQLLANGWTTQDIEEGFKAVVPPTSTTIPPVSPYAGASYSQNTNPVKTVEIQQQTFQPQLQQSPIQQTQTIKTSNHSSKKIFRIVLILFLLAAGASAYYFKDNLMDLFVSKDTTILENTPTQTNTELPGNINAPEQQNTVTPTTPESEVNKIFTAYIQELAKTKNFTEMIAVMNKYKSEKSVSELNLEISASSFDTATKELMFSLYKSVAEHFYAVVKTRVVGSSATVVASVCKEINCSIPEKIGPGSAIEINLILENNAWKIDDNSKSLFTEDKGKFVPVVSSITTTNKSNIYNNLTYRYSFQYPKSWEYSKLSDTFNTLKSPWKYPYTDKEQLQITILSNITSSLSNASTKESDLKEKGIQYTKDIISINNKPVTRILSADQTKMIGSTSYHERDYYLYFSDERVDVQNNGVVIDGNCSTFITGGGECSTAINDVMNKVVSTFKFN